MARDASIPTLVWQAIWRRALGAKELDHDVSGTSWQILVRAMLLITTMMPAWQRGHLSQGPSGQRLEAITIISGRIGRGCGRRHPE